METQTLNSAVFDTGLTVLLTCSLALLSITVIDGGFELRRWWKARRKNAATKAESGSNKGDSGK
jgi:hypothetical protein